MKDTEDGSVPQNLIWISKTLSHQKQSNTKGFQFHFAEVKHLHFSEIHFVVGEARLNDRLCNSLGAHTAQLGGCCLAASPAVLVDKGEPGSRAKPSLLIPHPVLSCLPGSAGSAGSSLWLQEPSQAAGGEGGAC